jgi:nicotinamidase-related amidase
MRILKNNTIALIVDVQERLFPHISDHEIIEKNINTLIQGLKALGIPIILTEQYKKGLGATIWSIRESLGIYNAYEKMCFSCYEESTIKSKIESIDPRTVILTGVEAHVCVLQTCIDLIEYNYIPVVVEDCVSSRKPNDKKIAIDRMRSEGAIITSYESILFELTRISGTQEFKNISKLVK